MPNSIPGPVIAADEQLHAILERVSFSRFLNPTNGMEAQRAFRFQGEPPQFTYARFVEADGILHELDAARPAEDHPAGRLVARCFDDVRLLVLALRDRTAEGFDALNQAAGWYPAPEELGLSFPDTERYDREPMECSALDLTRALRSALDARGLFDWAIELDRVMTARVLVDSAKRLLRVHPEARFHRRDLKRLVVHEIDVHVTRGHNGARQALHCFETGLPGSLLTEEGLAIVAEEEAGVASPGLLRRESEVLRAVHHARTAGFREVHRALAERLGEANAWGIAIRIKRGLADPESAGVYAKDTVYLRGRMRVRAYLDGGGPISDLYVGKVGIDDPIATWRAQGWVKEAPVPAVWGRLTGTSRD